MLRTVLAAFLGLAISLTAWADDQKTPGSKGTRKGREATITNVDQQNHTLTVKMKDKNGKETQKTFKLTETVRYLDSSGKAVAIDVFKSGDYVLVLEADGKLKEVRKSKEGNGKQR